MIFADAEAHLSAHATCTCSAEECLPSSCDLGDKLLSHLVIEKSQHDIGLMIYLISRVLRTRLWPVFPLLDNHDGLSALCNFLTFFSSEFVARFV